jgi:hypothetical protein
MARSGAAGTSLLGFVFAVAQREAVRRNIAPTLRMGAPAWGKEAMWRIIARVGGLNIS